VRVDDGRIGAYLAKRSFKTGRRQMQPSLNGRLLTLWIIVLAIIAWPYVTAGTAIDPAPVEVQRGSVTFDVGTNVLSLGVHGTSDVLKASAHLREGAEGLVIERVEAAVPVESLTTGLRLRDEHMRKYVFTTSSGEVPDLRFSAGSVTCPPANAPSTCQVSGELAVRGTPRPFTVALKISRKGAAFRVTGDGMVKLGEYGIAAPSQLGVTTHEDVKVHLDFTTSARPPLSASSRGPR
jgi:polyisoprenoid-binding protein YceI